VTTRIGGVGKRVSLLFEPRDVWVGVYVAEAAVYVCPLPTLVIVIQRGTYAGGRYWR